MSACGRLHQPLASLQSARHALAASHPTAWLQINQDSSASKILPHLSFQFLGQKLHKQHAAQVINIISERTSPCAQGIYDGRQLRGVHIAANAVKHFHPVLALIQAPCDDALVEAVCDEQVLQLADVGYVQLLHQFLVWYGLHKENLLRMPPEGQRQ
jgi:hypothetical protein